MDFEVLRLLGASASSVAVIGSIVAMFWKGDDAISDEAREALSKALQRLEVRLTPQSFGEQYIGAFNQVFGENHLSVRSFLHCMLVSFVSVTVLYGLWASFAPDRESVSSVIIGLLFAALFFNVLPDYVSLWQTRWVLNRLTGVNSTLVQFLWLIADLICTAFIFFFVSGLVMVLAFLPTAGGIEEMIVAFMLPFLFFSSGGDAPLGAMPELMPLFYSTFVTSLWIWLLALGQQLLGRMNVHHPLLFVLPIKTKPMRSIGLFLGLIAAVVLTFVWLVRLLIG
ncbi:hypothetical protein [Tateyamaria sp. SN6-1]|uniref:hypothetical protein n=1 Tax=Tateyamaria sp. SN6-1 TaxID=3092148 RepID=UPI0039F60169